MSTRRVRRSVGAEDGVQPVPHGANSRSQKVDVTGPVWYWRGEGKLGAGRNVFVTAGQRIVWSELLLGSRHGSQWWGMPTLEKDSAQHIFGNGRYRAAPERGVPVDEDVVGDDSVDRLRLSYRGVPVSAATETASQFKGRRTRFRCERAVEVCIVGH